MNTAELIAAIERELNEFGQAYEGLTLREKVLSLAEVLRQTRHLNIKVVRESGCDANTARERIRLYLVQFVGEVIDGTELEVVSGISEYGRRTRELRVESGYQILTGASNDPEGGVSLKPTQYLLLRAEPDREAAHRWHVAKRIRNLEGMGAKQRILAYFKENVGQIVTSEELAYVAKNAREFGRRARELRTQEGYAVATRFTGRPDLRMGEYILETLERIAEPHDRHIPKEVQEAVYKRDENACRHCGWNRERWTREDPRFLELHHITGHAEKGANVEKNLLVLCNVCHDDVHAGRVILKPLDETDA